MAAAIITSMLRRDPEARSYLLRFQGLPLLTALLDSQAASVRLSAAASLSAFATDALPAAPSIYPLLGAATDCNALALLLCAIVGRVVCDMASGRLQYTDAGNQSTAARDMLEHLCLALQAALAAVLSGDARALDNNRLLVQLVRLCDQCMRLGPSCNSTLQVSPSHCCVWDFDCVDGESMCPYPQAVQVGAPTATCRQLSSWEKQEQKGGSDVFNIAYHFWCARRHWPHAFRRSALLRATLSGCSSVHAQSSLTNLGHSSSVHWLATATLMPHAP